jgi:nucleoside-diphosphate-sugar epimerase
VTVLVTGATGIVGPYLLPRLIARGFAVHAVSRRPPTPTRAGVTWHRVDIEAGLDGLPPQAQTIEAAIHLAPLWLLPPLVDALQARGVRRLIAFGSTSRFTKTESRDPEERAVAARLAAAEAAVAERCGDRIPWTIFRPTLIYGGGRDKNVSTIAAFIRRVGFFPMVGQGGGLRQPVHADDLATACVLALPCRETFGRSYDLVGGTTLTYRKMVETVAQGLGRAPRVVTIPPGLLRRVVAAGRIVPGLRHLRASMVDRMAADQCFDASAATRDFGYDPRPFSYPGASPPVATSPPS